MQEPIEFGGKFNHIFKYTVLSLIIGKGEDQNRSGLTDVDMV